MADFDDYTTWSNYIRVLKLARKPQMEELLKISAVSGGGIVLLGVLGYVIYLVMTLTPS